jgi:predicted RNase H-like HicB family nuclease
MGQKESYTIGPQLQPNARQGQWRPSMKYRVLIEQDEDGVFVAEVPSLPGCISQGRTRAEATENIKEAISLYLESLSAHNEAVPPPITEELVEVEA